MCAVHPLHACIDRQRETGGSGHDLQRWEWAHVGVKVGGTKDFRVKQKSLDGLT